MRSKQLIHDLLQSVIQLSIICWSFTFKSRISWSGVTNIWWIWPSNHLDWIRHRRNLWGQLILHLLQGISWFLLGMLQRNSWLHQQSLVIQWAWLWRLSLIIIQLWRWLSCVLHHLHSQQLMLGVLGRCVQRLHSWLISWQFFLWFLLLIMIH